MGKKRSEKKKNRLGFYKNLNVGVRLSGGFLVITLLIILLGVVSTNNMNNVAHQTEVLNAVTSAELNISLARVEQVRYQDNPLDETAEKVLNYIDLANENLLTASSLMQSEANKALVAEMETEISQFEEEFSYYMQLTKEKEEKASVAAENATKLLEAIENTLISEEEYIDDLEDIDEIHDSHDKYVMLEDIMNSFLQVQVNVSLYLENETEENSSTMMYSTRAVDNNINGAIAIIKSKEVQDDLDIAKINFEEYETHLEEQISIAEQQLEAQEIMRSSAVVASLIAEEISLGVNDYITDLKSESNTMNIIVITLSIITSVTIATIVTRSVTKPIAKLLADMKRVSDYDISANVEEELTMRGDEIGALSKGLQDIVTSLSDILRDINLASEQVLASSQELSSTSQQVSDSSLDVARAIEGIADGATEQAKDTEVGVNGMEDLGQIVDKDQTNVDNLKIAITKVDTLKEEGLSLIKDLVEQTNMNSQASGKVYTIVGETNDKVGEIEQASTMIRNIASQTNLLALNASIEAARAGEAGKGFAVVADEIKTLAEQTSQFTGEIETVIKALMEQSLDAVSNMEEAKKITLAQEESVEKTNQKFAGISSAVEELQLYLNEVNESVKDMEAKKNEILIIIQNLAAISEENAASTEESSATIDEQTSAIEEISAASEELSRLAEEMKVTVTKFKL